MRPRQHEATLLAFAVALGLAAFVIARANLDVADGATRVQFLLVCGLAVATHLGLRRFAPFADQVVLPSAVLLNLLGLVMVHRLDIAEQTRAVRQGSMLPDPTFTAQAAWTMLGLSLLIALLVALPDHRTLQRYTYTAMVAGLVLLAMPLTIAGTTVNGARLWFRVGSVSFQPGEFAKLAIGLFFAGFLVDRRAALTLIRIRRWGLGWPRSRDWVPLATIWLVSVAILVFQRDLGMSLLFFGLFVTMLYLATGQRTWLAIGAVLFIAGSMSAYFVFDHVQARFQVWLDPFAYANDQGYQIVQGLYGLASGGLFGSGLGDGFPNLIPYAKSDSILAAFGEELGLVGLAAILMVFTIIAQRALRIAMLTEDPYGQLLAGGIGILLGLQVFIVAGGVSRLIPLTGLTTPLLSSGGSSLVATWLALALLLRISDVSNRARLDA